MFTSLLVLSATLFPSTVYVDASAPAGGSGATQAMAFPGFVDEFRVYPGVATSRRVAMSYASVADPDFAVFSEVRHVAKGLALILK